MTSSNQTVELLKTILENLNAPEKLDVHPWTRSQLVAEECQRDPGLASQSPGLRLAITISRLFHRMMPLRPPRHGKRLDARWGEFGLLAARYFAPFQFGLPYPVSLREAWQCIDRAILLFVNGHESEPNAPECARYRLVGQELEIAPNSTVSDWHRRGLERLAELIRKEEQRLETQAKAPGWRTWRSATSRSDRKRLRLVWRWLRWGFFLVLLAWLATTSWQAWRLYQRAQSVRRDAEALLAFSFSSIETQQIEATGRRLSILHEEMVSLQEEAMPFLTLAPYLGWLPVYGGDLTQAPALLEMGVQLSIAADETFQVVAPILPEVVDEHGSTSILDLLSDLKDAEARLLAAQVALSRARAARLRVQDERLSERTRALLHEKVDPLLLAMQGAFPADDALLMARLAPRLLGALGNGSQTYLILIQNEDELRPTGGFITAVGRMVVEDGRISQLTFEGSDRVDDFNKPYPSAPWQLNEYMRSEMLIFRDANWFTDFPTTVEWVKFLYAYSRPPSINGVIAIDQHVVVEILRVIGPVRVEGEEEPITAENVMTYLRTARSADPPPGVDYSAWDRKHFINRLAEPIVERLLARQGYSLTTLLETIIRLLDEKHILLQFDDPEMQELLTRRGWDGAVRPSPRSDFLMVVDTNVGFNKTNLVMEKTILYEVDLSDLAHPEAYLRITHTNHAPIEIECYQYPSSVGIIVPQEYPSNDCYWTYLRIYTPMGTDLIDSTPHAVPAGRTLREDPVPARTDQLGNENIPGVEVFGTLIVVPTGTTLQTDFQLRLPTTVLEQEAQAQTWTYRLIVQKQPGTLAVPLILRLRLPDGMTVLQSSSEILPDRGEWLLETDLRKDLKFMLVFAPSP